MAASFDLDSCFPFLCLAVLEAICSPAIIAVHLCRCLSVAVTATANSSVCLVSGKLPEARSNYESITLAFGLWISICCCTHAQDSDCLCSRSLAGFRPSFFASDFTGSIIKCCRTHCCKKGVVSLHLGFALFWTFRRCVVRAKTFPGCLPYHTFGIVCFHRLRVRDFDIKV